MKKLVFVCICACCLFAKANINQLEFQKNSLKTLRSQKAVVSPQRAPQQLDATKMILDSIYQFSWDTITKKWSSTPIKIFNSYNAKNLKTIALKKQWYNFGSPGGNASTNSVLLISRDSFIYNSSNLVTLRLSQLLIGNKWSPTSQTIFKYDIKNNLTDSIVQDWNDTLYKWNIVKVFHNSYDSHSNLICTSDSTPTSGFKMNNSFDAKNNLISVIEQLWNGKNWVNNNRQTNTYDTNNLMIGSLIEKWSAGTWTKSMKIQDLVWAIHSTGIIAANEEPLSYSVLSWDDMSSSWLNFFKLSNVVSNNNIISHLEQAYMNGSWADVKAINYTFDITNKLVSQIEKKWDENASIIVNSSKYSFTYDANNHQTSSDQYTWVGNQWKRYDKNTLAKYNLSGLIISKSTKLFGSNEIISQGDSTYNFYRTIVLTEVPNTKPSAINCSVFPNPSRGKFKVTSSESIFQSVEVYNLNGAKIYSCQDLNCYTKDIDLSAAPKGIYLLRIINTAGSSCQKILVQ